MQLMILEVSQKQTYIFTPRELGRNRIRSEQIAYVTSSPFFQVCCPAYDPEKNMVYSGGGHTVLRFPSPEEASAFAQAVTTQVLRDFPGMELYVKQLPYDPNKTPGENLLALSRALESKKARRQQSMRTLSTGLEAFTVPEDKPVPSPVPPAPTGWHWTENLSEIANLDNFLAVIHIDGNAMGKRVAAIYEKCGSDWERCTELLRQFSMDIDRHFAEAFSEMTEEFTHAEAPSRWNAGALPIYKLIGAGDDVCFITCGKLGMDCAASFLEHLSSKVNGADEKPYSACAGVVLTHKRNPFWQAYELSEALCRNAKTFVSDHGGDFCALDFHVEYGEMKASLSQIRQDYRMDDGGRMELRPLALAGNVPESVPEVRRYRYTAGLAQQLQRKSTVLPRSKIKPLRSALRQGRLETLLAMRMSKLEGFLDTGGQGDFYTGPNGQHRSLYYDAIELMDRTTLWRRNAP